MSATATIEAPGRNNTATPVPQPAAVECTQEAKDELHGIMEHFAHIRALTRDMQAQLEGVGPYRVVRVGSLSYCEGTTGDQATDAATVAAILALAGKSGSEEEEGAGKASASAHAHLGALTNKTSRYDDTNDPVRMSLTRFLHTCATVSNYMQGLVIRQSNPAAEAVRTATLAYMKSHIDPSTELPFSPVLVIGWCTESVEVLSAWLRAHSFGVVHQKWINAGSKRQAPAKPQPEPTKRNIWQS